MAQVAAELDTRGLSVDDVQGLREHFQLQRPEEIFGFLKQDRELPGLLLEIAANLKSSFGSESIPQLELTSYGDEGPSLRASMLWPGPISAARAALEEFDRHFWLANCDRGAGRVIVDYELV